jgi:hypothetical protein
VVTPTTEGINVLSHCNVKVKAHCVIKITLSMLLMRYYLKKHHPFLILTALEFDYIAVS